MSTHQNHLAPLIGTLADGLRTASEGAWEASYAAEDGEINFAIGTLTSIGEQLETLTGLCQTILALHRNRIGGQP